MYVLTPTVAGWGFFMRAASRAVWNSPSSPQMGEEAIVSGTILAEGASGDRDIR